MFHTLHCVRVIKITAKQSLTNHSIMIQTEGLSCIWYLFSVWYLEVPLWFWKGPVSSDSISSGCQLLDDHILLMQETHQPLAVVGHPALAVCSLLAPIKLDGVLGRLVLLQQGHCPRRAEAQQPTHNLHPNHYFWLIKRKRPGNRERKSNTDDSRKGICYKDQQ